MGPARLTPRPISLLTLPGILPARVKILGVSFLCLCPQHTGTWEAKFSPHIFISRALGSAEPFLGMIPGAGAGMPFSVCEQEF